MKYFRIQLDKNKVVVGKYASELPFEGIWENTVDVSKEEYNSIEFNTLYEGNI